MGILSSLLRKNSCEERERNIIIVGKNITLKKGKGKQYNLPYNIEAVGKNITWGKEEGDGNFWEENQDLKKWVAKNIKLFGTLYTLDDRRRTMCSPALSFSPSTTVYSTHMKGCRNVHMIAILFIQILKFEGEGWFLIVVINFNRSYPKLYTPLGRRIGPITAQSTTTTTAG